VRDPRCLAAIATVALAGALAPQASAKTDTVSRGNVTASLSYQKASFGFRNVHMRVVRDGVELVSERGPGFRPCSGACDYWPAFAPVDRRSIFLRNLDADPEPEVLGEFYTGGANCCRASRIYDFVPARSAYRPIDREWGTGAHRGARDLDADGSAELQSADARFRGLFGCTACTPQPIRIFKLREGRLVDVTRRYRGLVRRDLRGLIVLLRRARRDPLAARGVLAAVTAERYLLGRGRIARRGLERSLARGELRGVRGDGIADGRAYVRRLLRFLRRAGYRR
jgi:hypothetical protein